MCVLKPIENGSTVTASTSQSVVRCNCSSVQEHSFPANSPVPLFLGKAGLALGLHVYDLQIQCQMVAYEPVISDFSFKVTESHTEVLKATRKLSELTSSHKRNTTGCNSRGETLPLNGCQVIEAGAQSMSKPMSLLSTSSTCVTIQ